MKINTDGVVMQSPRSAAAGGVFRNAAGDWIGEFAMNIGNCSIITAELQGICQGLNLAWIKHQLKIQLGSDSLIAVNMLKRRGESVQQNLLLITTTTTVIEPQIESEMFLIGMYFVNAIEQRIGCQTLLCLFLMVSTL